MLIYLFLLNYLFISYVNCSSNNLYDNKDCPVEELNKESYKNLINKNKPTIIVFYAPWCGHCQRFAPEYIKGSKTLIQKYQNKVKFGAVNCVALGKLCKENDIHSFPSIRAFGFGKDIDKEYKKADGHTMNSMTTFLEKHKDVIFGNNKHLRGYSGDRDSFQLNITHNFESLPLNENTNKDNQLWRERAINTLARTASSTDKLHDALVSLRFMIEVDVLSQSLTQVQKNTISILFQYLVPLLPEEARSYFSKYYKKLQSTGILSSSTSKNTFQTHKEISIPNNLAESVYGQSLKNWRVCSSTKDSSLIRSDNSLNLIEDERKQILFESSRTGYTCGLWMLFHYITVASEHTSGVSTSDIMTLIRMIVENLFNCRTCREHFLDMYDRCLYGRCEIQPTDFKKLQIWLWNVHNDATLRILKYHLNITEIQNNQQLTTFQQQIRWPDVNQCNHCFKEKHLDPSNIISIDNQWDVNILTYLQKSYWNDSWKIITPLNLTTILLELNQLPTNKLTTRISRATNSVFISGNSINDDNNSMNIDQNNNQTKAISPLISNIPSFVFSVFIFFAILIYAFFYKKSLISNCLCKRTN